MSVLASTNAALIAGVDFSDAGGANDATPDDLNAGDGITVSTWSFPGSTGGVSFDTNANTGRVSAPVGKLNGPVTSGVAPVLTAVPTDGIHQFSIAIPANVTLDLTSVSFDHSMATGGANSRWIAFNTSLDTDLLYSQVSVARPAFTSTSLPLSGAPYTGLSGTTVDFIWYAGGEGSGDIDIDTIVIEGTIVAIPEPSALSLLALSAFALIRRKR